MAKYGCLLIILGSLLCAPAAQANQCAIERPNQYHPALTLITSPAKVDFELRQGPFTAEIRNVSSDPVYLLGRPYANNPIPTPPDVSPPLPSELTISHKIVDDDFYYWNSHEWRLVRSGVVSFTLYNEQIKFIDTSILPTCNKDGGIEESESVPEPQNTSIKVLYKEQLIDIPIILEYKQHPNYAEKLKYYNEPREVRRQQIFELVLMGSMIVAVILLFIFILIKGIYDSFNRHQQK